MPKAVHLICIFVLIKYLMTNYKCYIAVRLTLPAFVCGADQLVVAGRGAGGAKKMDGWMKQKNSGQDIGSSSRQSSVSTQNNAAPHANLLE